MQTGDNCEQPAIIEFDCDRLDLLPVEQRELIESPLKAPRIIDDSDPPPSELRINPSVITDGIMPHFFVTKDQPSHFTPGQILLSKINWDTDEGDSVTETQ